MYAVEGEAPDFLTFDAYEHSWAPIEVTEVIADGYKRHRHYRDQESSHLPKCFPFTAIHCPTFGNPCVQRSAGNN